MERMWRKVNHSLTGRTSKSSATIQSTDTTSSAGFGEGQVVVAVANSNTGTGNLPSSTATGRRLAASGVQSQTVVTPSQQKSLSQHVLLNSTASSERRRRRRRKSRPRRSGDMSSGGFGHQQMDSTNQHQHHHQQQMIYQPLPHPPLPPPVELSPPPLPQQQQTSSQSQTQSQTSSSSALMMGVGTTGGACYPPIVAPTAQQQDTSLRQRAVAKLRMFNFHLNWDLHMTQCKPCGPRSGGGNIITRRLCRNRRREDNELYRSNSFKFERFERKECSDELTDTLQKKISICDDYSLPIDFVKKRPSSFDPCLAEAIPNPETWVAPSPLSDLVSNHVNFIEPPSAIVGGATAVAGTTTTAAAATAPPPPPPPPSSSASGNVVIVNTTTSSHLHSLQPTQQRSHHHPPLPNTIKQASVKLIEGYSDPKDTKRPKKVYHKKSKPRKDHKRSNYSSDSSAPKSSADEDNNSVKVPELNSPDSISEDLVRPLPPLHRSPRKVTSLNSDVTANSKRNPSPYYYSDLLKAKDTDKETKQKSRQSTASEPPQLTQPPISAGAYRKSTSLDVPEVEREQPESDIAQQQLTPKRYSFTEEGVRIIRCTTPSTTTSDDSDCSECQKRREWHARALALVRQTCNIQGVSGIVDEAELQLQLQQNEFLPLESELQSMPPHRLLGPAVCACAAPTLGDDLDEYFRPRSIFYVHPQGVHECVDCSASTTSVNNAQEASADREDDDDGEMSGGRTRQFYETAFDCKIAKSDDDLDEVDRITNHSVLLQIDNGNNVPKSKPPSDRKTRLEGKRLKNSKNQAIQDKTNACATAAGGGTINSTSTTGSGGAIAGSISALSSDLENVHIEHGTNVDQMNNTTSNSQLPMRGYTPSPPSTAPLPMKFPSKHDRFFMNSIKSAPNLPSSNPAAHPRLKDLRLPIPSHHRAMNAGASADSQSSSFAEPKSRTRPDRPRSFVLESGRVLELRKSAGGGSSGHHHHAGHAQTSSNNSSPANARRQHQQHNYSSTESIATSSSGGSMESLRSSTSEGNRSTSSSGSRHSTSLSSHSSESGSSLAFPLRAPIVIHSKLHILSPISDKSSQEPASDASEFQKNATPDEQKASATGAATDNNQQAGTAAPEVLKKQRRPPPNKTLLHLADEILGSDSGISLHSRGDEGKSGLHKFTLPKLNFPPSDKTDSGIGAISSLGLPQDLRDLPFDMPKLRRRKTLQQDTCTSGSATSVDLGDLPFDMPKLRRRLRMNQADMTNLLVHSTESSGISQASSSHSMRDENKVLKLDTAIFRQNLTLNLNEPPRSTTKFGSLDLRSGNPSNKELNLNLITGFTSAVDLIDISVPLERQGWYHGAITRIEAETTLRPLSEGSFLVRNCESTKQDYSLSLKGAKGFMHMRIQRNESGQYILGQFSRPFDSVPEMIRHFCLNRLPVRGAEHMCLIDPVIAQLL